MDVALAVQDMSQAVSVLRGMPEVSGGVASVGYCMGGLLSYLCAANAGVDAAVCYYGGGIDSYLNQADKVSCPILFHFAENDQHISKAAVDAVRAAFGNARNAVIETYANADHGFNCWERPSYNQKASAVAHGMSLSFLGKVL
jgi:carboxymethylenebutenolidase